MVRRAWGASLSPGNEQLGRWSQESADRPSSFNYAGAKQPALDAMIAALLAARTREDFVAAVRALDRVLISGAYVVPLFYLPDQRVAYWTRVQHPDTSPINGPNYPDMVGEAVERRQPRLGEAARAGFVLRHRRGPRSGPPPSPRSRRRRLRPSARSGSGLSPLIAVMPTLAPAS